ncbi:MAG: hypothetical protein A2073_00170 [Deltaproteobacteria bacterium GWC2_42_11]|nr:MAG: hypothetical protein A2073_00170 [Deltaproteobacteria bacterium GWC2_42_11]HBO84513.1 hypothetical protein [Deltaproteobacteria bacterium]
MAYKIKLEIFEGPLELLLHLIKKNEVDIYDIPIAKITEQYLEYLEMMKTLNLDIAGEFLLMAATLVHIKSRMLLPVSEEAAEETEEGKDPRLELIRKLLEYQKYKEAAGQLDSRQILGRDIFRRGDLLMDSMGDEGGLVNMSIFELLDSLKTIIEKAPKTISFDVSLEKITITDKINFIMEVLGRGKSVTFFSLFPENSTRHEIIVTFLAMLELAKMRMMRVFQSEDGVIRLYIPQTEAI